MENRSLNGPLFLTGVSLGIIICVLSIVILEKDPKSVKHEIYKQAVELKYGRWVIDTNKIHNREPPTVQFQWITNWNVK